MNFEFATAGRILFGAGRAREAGAAARSLGRHAFVVTGRNAERTQAIRRSLEESGLAVTAWSVAGEPTIDAVTEAVGLARESRCDCAVGIGGGSALDAGKAVAALAPNPGGATDYLEIVGRGQPLQQPSLPYLAIPTTAGTGSEATRNAVLGSPERRVKVSLRGPWLLPRIALVDPELTYGLPPAATAATGMDALTQLIEPFVCSRANPITDTLCREGLARVARSLRRAFAHGSDTAARGDMAVASLFGGIALANAGLGAAHGFSSAVGGRYGAPHGAVCAALVAPSMEINLRAARAHRGGADRPDTLFASVTRTALPSVSGRAAPPVDAIGRYAEIARILTGRPDAAPEEGVRWVRELVADLGLPGLRAYGARPEDATAVSEQAAQSNSMRANPVALTAEERAEMFILAL